LGLPAQQLESPTTSNRRIQGEKSCQNYHSGSIGAGYQRFRGCFGVRGIRFNKRTSKKHARGIIENLKDHIEELIEK
jgi:hypothetical protein